MDEAKLAKSLAALPIEWLEAARDELDAYIAHRKAPLLSPAGSAKAPFNFGKFLQNFIKIVQAVAPIVKPLIGLDTAEPARDFMPPGHDES